MPGLGALHRRTLTPYVTGWEVGPKQRAFRRYQQELYGRASISPNPTSDKTLRSLSTPLSKSRMLTGERQLHSVILSEAKNHYPIDCAGVADSSLRSE